MNSESKMKPWKPAMEETQIGAFCGSLPANIFESVQSPMTAIDRQKRCSDCISNEYHFVVFCNKCFAINCCRCIFKNKNKCSICQEVQENMKIERSNEDYSKKLGHQCLLETFETQGQYREKSEKSVHFVTQGARKARQIWTQNILRNPEVLNLCYEKLVAACEEKFSDTVFKHFGNANDLINLATAELTFVPSKPGQSYDVESFVQYNNRLWEKQKERRRQKIVKAVFAITVIMIVIIFLIITNIILFID